MSEAGFPWCSLRPSGRLGRGLEGTRRVFVDVVTIIALLEPTAAAAGVPTSSTPYHSYTPHPKRSQR